MPSTSIDLSQAAQGSRMPHLSSFGQDDLGFMELKNLWFVPLWRALSTKNKRPPNPAA
jgi:hypothetical protein